MADPTAGSDGATKMYIDRAIANAGHMKIDGGTAMTGKLIVRNHKISNVDDPTSTQDVTYKNCVDTSLAIKKLNLLVNRYY
jgi:hypothetical protein